MKIASSVLSLQSNREFVQKDEKSEELEIWFDRRGTSGETPRRSMGLAGDRVTLSGRCPQGHKARGKNKTGAGKAGLEDEELAAKDPELYMIKTLVEAITGRKIKVSAFDPSELEASVEDTRELDQSNPADADENTAREGWGLIYNSHESHYEAEKTTVAINGAVRTQDGKEVNFSLNIEMSREFYTEENISLRAGDATKVDPLVINFGGSAAELTDTKFAFDLDSDGQEENISFVRQGSGLLVFDKNNDGKVNDGSELFGPRTGDGFAELGVYDEDGNQWIDENDSIYDRLSIWTKSEDGSDSLNSLRSSSIGAIFLGAVESRFDLRGSGNALNGQISRSGVYLEEDGEAKSIQQLDLTV